MPLTWNHEDAACAGGHACIAGVDEAGRGCLAGPVVAGAVVFLDRAAWPEGLDDSKKLTRARRRALFETLTTDPRVVWAVGRASVEEIDRVNILQAAMLAMRRAVEGLPVPPGHLLVDGNRLPGGPVSGSAVVGGDALSPSIAAASILAKETRDRIMEELDRAHPGYGFAQHKGYGTAAHVRALEALGLTPHHRRTFAPVAQRGLPLAD